jgi:hypothetical protein
MKYRTDIVVAKDESNKLIFFRDSEYKLLGQMTNVLSQESSDKEFVQ